MKRLTFIIAVAVAVCLGACAHNEKKKETKKMKTLVAYFSATGTTAAVATQLAEVAGADIYEIKPQTPYTSADLDWQDKKSRSTIEMADKSSRPAISGKVGDISQYDVIHVGYPIWWYVAPTIINTFLESYNLDGKTIIPFFTSGGSGAGKTMQYLKPSAPKANWKEPKSLNGASKDDLKKWVEENR